MKRQEEAYLVSANGESIVTDGMFLELSRGYRWTSDKSRAYGFTTITNALNIVRELGLREGEVNVEWHRIEVEVPDAGFNHVVQNIEIRKGKVFRADGRVEALG